MDQDTLQALLPGLALVVSFLVGSIPFGIIVARLFKVKELTKSGSGNIGATNVARVVGFWPAGFLTFVLDGLKGAIPVLLLKPAGVALWAGALGLAPYEFADVTIWSAGFAAVLGHCYTPWLQFRGGKGVATGFGALLVLSPWAALGGFGGFGAAFLSTRIGSLSSLSGLGVASIIQVVVEPIGAYLWAGAAMVFLVLLRHEKNIEALLEDRERKF